MNAPDEAFLALLRSTFRLEAEEHLQVISAGLLALERERDADARPAIERVFRAAHTLKGAARAADFGEVERLCQSLEEVFSSWKRGQEEPTPGTLDAMLRTVDEIAAALGRPPADTHAAAAGGSPVPAMPDPLPAAGGTEPLPPSSTVTVRVPFAQLETQLLRAEEILQTKLAAAQRAADLRELAARIEAWRTAATALEPHLRDLRARRGTSPALPHLLDFVDWTAETLKSIEASAAALSRAAEQDRHAVGKLVDDLLEESKKLLLLPFGTISGSFQKLVRDLSRDQGKEVDLVIEGEEVQLDKRILEEIKAPLVHLLRNSVDHGIELPDERLRRGKPARGTVTLAVSQVNGSKVRILLSDDGAGIEAEQVREASVRAGAIGAEEARGLGEAAALRLIFRSQVTTSRVVTEVSGRGLGLAIVQENAERLGGHAEVESRPGHGTTFRIVVPATRATFRGILVEVAGRVLVVPTTQVERVGRAPRAGIRTVEGRETISFDGRAVALVRMADVLEFPESRPAASSPGDPPILVLGNGDHRVAFAVDAVLDEQEVLVKPLAPPLVRVRNVSATTVLGTGRVAAILNVGDLLQSARRTRGSSAVVVSEPESPPAARKSVLIAEDSITSRMLLKSILESAGYRVRTAVDGMEAVTLLRTEHFDLVVSDVEMPRLNGFDLTARIRADPRLADLPVVLVTALETREDRERGIDLGADAYIVKGRFDQSDLLDAVRRLLR